MKKTVFIILFLTSFGIAKSQQYPWWTQYRGQQYMLNPGFCGGKRIFDARLNYRNQWTGYDGAPKTYALSINSSLLKKQLGVGGFIFQDNIGPFRSTVGSVTLAYHLKFSDSKLSFGIQGNFMSQKFVGTDISLRNQQDNAVNQYLTDKTNNFDGSFGIVYYNDRFHVAVGANNMLGSEFEYYKNDSIKKGKYKNVPHYTVSAGYNWAEDPNLIFQNSLMAVYTDGMPFVLDYTLRLHIKQQLIAGIGIRIKDAISLQLGYTLMDQIQIVYSYDFITSPLRKYQSGSHELQLVYSTNFGLDGKKRGLNKEFVRQKFQYLL